MTAEEIQQTEQMISRIVDERIREASAFSIPTEPVDTLPDTRGFIEEYTPNQFIDSSEEFDVRGTKGPFKIIALRAYWNPDHATTPDELVDAATAYNASTMYLYRTWDYERWP